jgi:uncharacterized protein (DUF952 family)
VEIIYHITTQQEWNNALQNGFYEAPSLYTEGFIHCSTVNQVQSVVERYYKGINDLVKLVIDTHKLTSIIKYELAPSVNEEFPHVFGIININSVIEVQAIHNS